jgi:hypothetical protein
MVGGILMEAAQAIVGYADDTFWSLTSNMLFDLGVDALAALLGIWLARLFQRHSATAADS